MDNFKQISRIIFINTVILFILIELCSYVYIKVETPNIGYMQKLPTYLDFSIHDKYEIYYNPLGPYVIDSSYPWSTWHPRNSSFRSRKSCFDVIMRFNAEGTRGMLPNPQDSSTVFFIGDSFTEGYGLPEDSTLASLYGMKTGNPVLNLGCSGYIGTTQYSLIYDHFAKKYQHKQVYVCMFLGNDFMENDIDLYDDFFGTDKRFRPYRSDSNNLEIITYKGHPDSSLFSWNMFRKENSKEKGKLIQKGLLNYWRSANGGIIQKLINLTYFRRLVYVFQKKNSVKMLPGELNYTEQDFKIVEYDIRTIMKTADTYHSSVTFLNIPSNSILLGAIADPKIEGKYLDLEKQIQRVIQHSSHKYISLYSYIKNNGIDANDLTFSCDNHFNASGNLMLSNFITSKH